MAAVAATMLLAGPAAAVTVNGAKTIRITSVLPDWLQVGEVQAFALTGTNVALASNGGTAVGSGNYVAESNPGKAIDGLSPVSYPDIYHSDSPAAGEFLEVTLAAPANLASLTLFGRVDCCVNRDFYAITIFDSLGATLFSGELDNRTLNGGGNTLTFDVAPPVGGVPEPASWALMIGGFGMVGGAMRRRTGISAVAS